MIYFIAIFLLTGSHLSELLWDYFQEMTQETFLFNILLVTYMHYHKIYAVYVNMKLLS